MLIKPMAQRFIYYYIQTGNGAESARKAGYKNSTIMANRLLRRPEIQEELSKAVSEIGDKLNITATAVIAGLYKEATDYIEGTPASRVSAWSILARHYLEPEQDKTRQATHFTLNIGDANIQMNALMAPDREGNGDGTPPPPHAGPHEPENRGLPVAE